MPSHERWARKAARKRLEVRVLPHVLVLSGLCSPGTGRRSLPATTDSHMDRYALLPVSYCSSSLSSLTYSSFGLSRRDKRSDPLRSAPCVVDYGTESSVSSSIYVIYAGQASFYLHSVYATLFLDAWRKDSLVLLAHHVITTVLLCVSWAARSVLHTIARSPDRVTASLFVQVSPIGTHHDLSPRHL